jgi:hypothetical protein
MPSHATRHDRCPSGRAVVQFSSNPIISDILLEGEIGI